jgi:lactobin A/cerein 7B family class IIb bacteriocin
MQKIMANENLEIIELKDNEIEAVSGGFICGGLCIVGTAFAAGALFGSGFAIGYYNEKEGK